MRQVVKDLVVRRWNIGKQLLHQLVVIVGQFFEHLKARFFLARGHATRQLDNLAFGVLAINVGALGCEIHKAGRDAVLPNRDLA